MASPIQYTAIRSTELSRASIKGLVVIARREIGLRAVSEVADIVQRHPVALNRGPGQHGNIVLPVTVVGRSDSRPPGCHQGKGCKKAYIRVRRRPGNRAKAPAVARPNRPARHALSSPL